MSLKQLKILKAVLVTVISGVLAVFLVNEGADPTAVGLATITLIGLVNGIDLSEWIAAREALAKSRENDSRED